MGQVKGKEALMELIESLGHAFRVCPFCFQITVFDVNNSEAYSDQGPPLVFHRLAGVTGSTASSNGPGVKGKLVEVDGKGKEARVCMQRVEIGVILQSLA